MLQEEDWKSIRALGQRNARSEAGPVFKAKERKRGQPPAVGLGKPTKWDPRFL